MWTITLPFPTREGSQSASRSFLVIDFGLPPEPMTGATWSVSAAGDYESVNSVSRPAHDEFRQHSRKNEFNRRVLWKRNRLVTPTILDVDADVKNHVKLRFVEYSGGYEGAC